MGVGTTNEFLQNFAESGSAEGMLEKAKEAGVVRRLTRELAEAQTRILRLERRNAELEQMLEEAKRQNKK